MSEQLSKREENAFLRAIGEPVEEDIMLETVNNIIKRLETKTINTNYPKYIEGYDCALNIVKGIKNEIQKKI